MYVPNPHSKPNDCIELIEEAVDSAYSDAKSTGLKGDMLLGQVHVILGQSLQHLRERAILYDYKITIDSGLNVFYKLTKLSDIEQYDSLLIRRDEKLNDLLNMEVLKPPHRKLSIFLGGSIEMGVAKDWQKMFESELKDEDVVIYNPRRDDWDSSWEQSIWNKQFKEQVVWELDHLEKCDVVVMYFAEGTKSPISLLEFGLYARTNKLIVYCPDGFWRKGNVDIVCEMYGVSQVRTEEELLIAVKSKI